MENKSSIGFTIIELLVAISIVAVLSGIILFSITQYINKGRDSNMMSNLAVLVPAGETYYNAFPNSYGDSSANFCGSSAVTNAILQMPKNPNGACTSNDAGLCCNVDSTYYNKWAACAKEFANSAVAYCVDSRGVKKEICKSSCSNSISSCDVSGDNYPTCSP